MLAGLLAFSLGVITVQALPALPGAVLLAALVLAAAGCICQPRWRPLGAGLLGFVFAAVQAQGALGQRLPDELEGEDLLLIGEVVELPQRWPGYLQFTLRPESMGELPSERLPRRVRLAWYGDSPSLQPGERWRLGVRLKRPHGQFNPGGFDYERWLFARGVDARGYVLTWPPPRRLSASLRMDTVRFRISAALERALAGRPAAGLVLALVVGDTRLIEETQWQVLRATGTTHLVAISGLHVGLVAGLVYAALGFLWRRLPGLCLALPSQLAGAFAGTLAALGYAALAGFSLPTQRALIMLAVPAVALLARRRLPPWRGWTLALVAVLLWDPFAPLSPGFWLSFGAVAVLIGLGAVRAPAGRLSRAVRLQVAISVALIPLTVLWFDQAPWLSPLANLVAIPVVGLGLVPLALLSALTALALPAMAPWLLLPAAELGRVSLEGLAWLAGHGGDGTLPQLPGWVLACAWLAAAVATAPRGLAPRTLALPLLLPLLLYRPVDAEPRSTAHITVLDVGQGLSVVVEVGRRVLVFDTGPAFGTVDAGTRVVLPFLRARGISRVDRLVVSHGDSDHSGGAASLQREIELGEILSGEPLPMVSGDRPCHAGQRWDWDGVSFEMLWPPAGSGLRGNDASCVLRVSIGEHALLLTGDLLADGERALLAASPERLRAALLLVPHHGSLTSSTRPFVAAVAPEVAIAPAGYRNRYRLPRPEVVARYQETGARLLVTYATGALRFELSADGLTEPVSYRRQRARYYHQPAQM